MQETDDKQLGMDQIMPLIRCGLMQETDDKQHQAEQEAQAELWFDVGNR